MSTTIESLEVEILASSKSAADGIDALTESLARLKGATKGGLGLPSLSKDLSGVKGALTKIATVNKNTSSSFTDLYHKIKAGANTLSFISKKIWSAIGESNDYTEAVNLFTVSLGAYANEAKEYAETVSEAIGIDTGEWMESQGIFMTLATGFGVASDRAYTMSKNLTQLGYDLSSFFNIDVADAMQKLQSGISGELEPLRRIGYDLSQAKLEATALELGIDKTVSSMTQAEKAQLRYYAIMTQVTVAQGDMARTLNAPANQLRVLRAQFNMAAREIGNIFIPTLNAVLPYLIAATKVIRILANSIANIVGFEMPEVDYSGVNAMGNAAENTNNALDESAKSAKKLKSYMLGFDELNVLNPNEDSSTSADDLLGQFNFELPEYDFLEGLTESRINEIVKQMKEWLGITEDIDSWSELFDTRLGDILKTVGLIGAGIAAWKITSTFASAITAIQAILSSPTYTIAISAMLVIIGITMAASGLKDAVENGLDGFNFGEIVGGGLLTVGASAVLGAKLATWIATAFKGSAVNLAIHQAGINLGVGTVGAAGAAIFAAITAIIVGIPTYIVGIYDACVEGIDWLNSALIGVGATLTGAGIGAIIGMLGGPIGAGIGALIGLAVGLVTDLVILIVQKWDEISAWFVKLGDWFNVNVIQPIGSFFKGLWVSVSGFFVGLWEDIVGVWNTVADWFNTKVIQPIVNFFAPIVEIISQFFEGCWLIIRAVWLIVSTWFNENVIIPVVGFFKGLWESVSGFFKELWSDIKAIWNVVATWFDTTVIVPVVGFFKGVWTAVSGFFTQLWEDIKAVWEIVSDWFNKTIIEPVKTAFEIACTAIGEFFSNLWLGIRRGVASAMNGVIGAIESAINWIIRGINSLIGGFDKIVQWAADVLGESWGGMSLVQEVKLTRVTVPEYADGAYDIPAGQMFIAREAGAEMVGSIGRKTAVANNDQIVSGIAGGVATANEEQNALLREQNSLLRAILEKDSSVYLDGKNLTNSVEKYQRERGRVLITGGVL